MDANALQQNDSVAWRVSEMFVLCCLASRVVVLF